LVAPLDGGGAKELKAALSPKRKPARVAERDGITVATPSATVMSVLVLAFAIVATGQGIGGLSR
jgi:hypothetical protein